jgi:hypothetical protein
VITVDAGFALPLVCARVAAGRADRRVRTSFLNRAFRLQNVLSCKHPSDTRPYTVDNPRLPVLKRQLRSTRRRWL